MVTLSRSDAGRRLALGLAAIVKEPPVVIALSLGGVRVANEIARAFGAPIDVVAGLRLEVPGRCHSTFGAVADGSAVILPERIQTLQLPEDYVDSLVEITRREAERTGRGWRNGAPEVSIEGRLVILADDGMSDGLLVSATTRALREHGARRIVFAAPAVSGELAAVIDRACDDHLLLFPPAPAVETLVCDARFEQTTRADVATMIRQSRADFAVPVST